jgi:hypothetical protein
VVISPCVLLTRLEVDLYIPDITLVGFSAFKKVYSCRAKLLVLPVASTLSVEYQFGDEGF